MNRRIAVVGGGLVGATLALALDRAGLSPVVVEPRPPVPGAESEDPRTVALSPASIALLTGLGVWGSGDAAVPGICAYDAMEVWDADGTGRVRFEASELGVPSLGTITPNGHLLARLWARLEDRGVECVTDAGVVRFERDARGARLTLEDGRRIEAALVAAADGGRSRVRELAAISAQVNSMGQLAVATTAAVERPHEDTAWQRFLATGPLAFLPLPDDDVGRHRVSVVWSLDEAEAVAIRELDDASFAAALERAFEGRLGRVLGVAPRGSFPLLQVHAERYVAERLVLVGDAAHVVHPLAGQGVNLGLKDVAVLVEVLDGIARGPAGARLGDAALLGRYERARRGDNALALGAMDGLKRLFGADDPGLRLLRNTGLAWVDRLAPVKRAFAEHALGLA
ncbi:MAG: UbiH/UbiF/VisC/COQ6 family ubiquinone biosynthesis hydroxylase [Pseudomonadales bacterium]|jgi:2-octaprenylphenol hydroxylase|nr:UbiH/UbiF/VisC/COQ6 family ubiquinone biosynthesis hydroxylase [Pseudomonadales bacterium]